MVSQCAGAYARFQTYAAGLPNLDEILEADELLRQYRFYFRQVREGSRYLLGSQGEDIMAKMQLSGSSAWSDLQAYLTSTVSVDYNGGATNLSAIRNLTDPDPAVRKAAYGRSWPVTIRSRILWPLPSTPSSWRPSTPPSSGATSLLWTRL